MYTLCRAAWIGCRPRVLDVPIPPLDIQPPADHACLHAAGVDTWLASGPCCTAGGVHHICIEFFFRSTPMSLILFFIFLCSIFMVYVPILSIVLYLFQFFRQSCSSSKQVWWNVLSTFGQPQGLPNFDTIFDWWTAWRSMWTGTNRHGADSVFTLVAWELWKERNARCFRGATTQLPQLHDQAWGWTMGVGRRKKLGLSPVQHNSLANLVTGEGMSFTVICLCPPPCLQHRQSVLYCKLFFFLIIQRRANLLCVREKKISAVHYILRSPSILHCCILIFYFLYFPATFSVY
jgi:hypothetical protein